MDKQGESIDGALSKGSVLFPLERAGQSLALTLIPGHLPSVVRSQQGQAAGGGAGVVLPALCVG